MKDIIKELIEGLNIIVRPIVTLTLVITLCWGFVTGKVSAETFIGTVAVVIGFWFRDRQEVVKQKDTQQ